MGSREKVGIVLNGGLCLVL